MHRRPPRGLRPMGPSNPEACGPSSWHHHHPHHPSASQERDPKRERFPTAAAPDPSWGQPEPQRARERLTAPKGGQTRNAVNRERKRKGQGQRPTEPPSAPGREPPGPPPTHEPRGDALTGYRTQPGRRGTRHHTPRGAHQIPKERTVDRGRTIHQGEPEHSEAGERRGRGGERQRLINRPERARVARDRSPGARDGLGAETGRTTAPPNPTMGPSNSARLLAKRGRSGRWGSAREPKPTESETS